MNDSPITRLREQHSHLHLCGTQARGGVRPCDVIAALDALEAELDGVGQAYRGEVRHADAQQARLDAATELVRQAMKERHTRLRTISGQWAPERRCGASITTSIDTCPKCAPYRAWLGGKEEE